MSGSSEDVSTNVPRTILGICGSLRAESSNLEVLRAFLSLRTATVRVEIYCELVEIPPFNPDLDTDAPPLAVQRLRDQLRRAHAVVFSTPEYAHGVPGVLKNALDWTVSSGEFVDKPVAILKPSARGDIAIASLRETLTVMSAKIIEAACATLPLNTNRIEAGTLLKNGDTAALLHRAFANLVDAIHQK